MKTLMTSLFLISVTALAMAVPDDLASMITAEDGWVAFTYPASDDVHCHSHTIVMDGNEVVVDEEENDGLVHTAIKVRSGRVVAIETRTGRGRSRSRHEKNARVIDNPTAEEASDYLLDLARHHRDEEVAESAVTAAAISSAETWPTLLEMARDHRLDREVRESAIFWLGVQAGEKVSHELEAIVDDDSEEMELREHAVFALSQALEDNDEEAVETLGRIATENPHTQLRQSALFWLAQHDDPAVLDLFESILLD